MLSCLGDSAIPTKDRTDDPRLRLNEVITMSGQRWRLTRVGQLDANLSGAGLRIGWLLRHQAPILSTNAVRCTYEFSLSAHGGRVAPRCMCFRSSRGFRHLYDFPTSSRSTRAQATGICVVRNLLNRRCLSADKSRMNICFGRSSALEVSRSSDSFTSVDPGRKGQGHLKLASKLRNQELSPLNSEDFENDI